MARNYLKLNVAVHSGLLSLAIAVAAGSIQRTVAEENESLTLPDVVVEPAPSAMSAKAKPNGWPQPEANDSGSGTTGYSKTQGIKTLLFMPVAFADDPTPPISRSAAYQLMDQVNQWYVDESYNTVSILTDVTPLLILPQTKAYYAAQGTGVLQTDARAAALAAGFDTDNYDLDIVNNQILGPPNFYFAGSSTIGGKGMILQIPSLTVTTHELGHNFGLWHANSWTAPGDSIIGPGGTLEYGNTFDTMGPKTSAPELYDFNAEFKHQLNWLPSASVATVTHSGVYRIYAFDVPHLMGGQQYALRIKKDYARNYWAEYRQKFTNNPWTQNGILLNWNPWNNAVGNSLGGTTLLDTTPGTPAGNHSEDDAPLVIGRTFSDLAAGIYLTPIAKGTADGGNWIDVQANLGRFPTNLPPTLQIVADATNVALNTVVHFTATASDPNGDPLAYAWDFGDLTFGANAATVTKSWAASGEYVVHCTVSDTKGGVASRNVVVAVGAPGTFRVNGGVTTSGGQPLADVRVSNGLSGSAYRGAYTDSDGDYVLANLAPGSNTLSAIKYGYAPAASGWSNPVNVGPSLTNVNWVASPNPMVGVTASDSAAAETGLDTGTFTLTRSGSLTSALTVNFNLSGSADYLTDYTLTPAPATGSTFQFTIPAGMATTNIVLTPLPDNLVEGPETATLTLFENSAYVLGSAVEATITIADGQPPAKPTVTVSAVDALAPKSGSDAGVFQLARAGNLAGDLTVRYAVGGTATAGIDYTPLNGTVIIPAGQANALVSFNAIDNALVNGDQTVTVTASADSAYTVGAPATASATISEDNPPAVIITATDDLATEGRGHDTFTVTRIGSLAANLLVHYALGGTASNGVDYTTLPGTVLIPAGLVSADIPVVPLTDGLVEGTETVTATVLNNPGYNIGNLGAATASILDADTPGVTLSASQPNAAEAGPVIGEFTFSRNGPVAGPLAVDYNISGTALNGTDYTTISNRIIIPAGSASAVLSIVPVDDAIKEISETVVITLQASPDSAYSVVTTTPKTVTIADNDSGNLVGVSFSAAAASGPESQYLVNVGVSLSAPSAVSVTVDCKITGGTAVNGADYATDLPETIYFPAGSVSQNVTVAGVTKNNQAQPDRTVVASLSNPVNAQLDAVTNFTYTILDDDGAGGTITVAAINPNASETGPTPGIFRIARAGATSQNLTVNFQVTGTASSPGDYLPIGNSALIPAGQNYMDIVVMPVDDATPEPSESVTLTLTSAPGAAVGTANAATLWIADNDSTSNSPIVSLVASVPTAWAGGPDDGVFTIFRDRNTNDVLPVSFTVRGSAVSGVDYASIGSSVTLLPGMTQTNITVIPLGNEPSMTSKTVVPTLTVDGSYRVDPAFASATVTLTATREPLRFDLSPPALTLTNGGLQLRLLGLAGAGPVVVYASTNLVIWQSVLTNPPVVGTWDFIDPAVSNSNQRYYRAVEMTSP